MYTGGGDAIISQNERTLSTHLRETKALKLHQQTYRQKTQQRQHQQQQQETRERGKNREDLGKCAPTRKAALAKGERRAYDRAVCLFPFMGEKNPPPNPLQVHPKKEIPEVWGDGISWKRRFYFYFSTLFL